MNKDGFRVLILAAMAAFVAGFFLAACGWKQQVNVKEPNIEMCAARLVQVQEVQTEAAKLGLEPDDVAKYMCLSMAKALELVEANRAKVSAIARAGAPNWLPLNLAGASH